MTDRLRRVRSGRAWLLLPVAILYVGVLLLPMLVMTREAFATGLDGIRGLFTGFVFWKALENTVVISLTTTAVTLPVAYLLAAAMWRARPVVRVFLLMLIMLPFWTSVLVKNFAWAALLRDNGLINNTLLALGLIDQPLALLHTRFAVIVGMTHYLIPYAVFPIFAAMLAIDRRLERAASSLGASRTRVFTTVVLPLSRSGVYAGGLLVFIICLGFFITPVILGGPSDAMLGTLILSYALELADVRTASLIALVLVLAVSWLIVLYQRKALSVLLPTEAGR